MLMKSNIEIWNIINIVTGCVDWIIFFLFIDTIVKRRISNKKYILGMLIIFILTGAMNVAKVFPNVKILMCMLLGTIFCITSYKEKVYKCISISLIYWTVLMASEGLAVGLVVMLNKLNSVNIVLDENLFRIQCILLSKLFLFVGIILIKYLKLSLEIKFKDMLLVGLPIISNIVSLLLIFEYNLKSSNVTTTNIIRFVFTILLIVSSTIILLIVISKIIKEEKVKLEYGLINERIKANHRSYENINEIQDRLKYVYHDLKNHMICIKSYETKEEIISYVDSLEFQINDFENIKNTGNKTLDIILSEKRHICKNHNIKFEENINISKLDFIQDIDVCAIFANAIDNAIEACKNMDNKLEKIINVKATYINEFAIIKFTNTKVNEIKVIDERIQSSKRDNKNHGVGLASIQYVASKYDGESIVNYSDNEFTLKIMIPIKN
ncbi:MAG: GHKL domain-containing protein [Peptostreptococcaceae bacterium]